jgi:1-acyl-sn-glycerol-3-phosphate acyltransferase
VRKLAIYALTFGVCALLFLVLAPLAVLFPTVAWRNRLSCIGGRLLSRAAQVITRIHVEVTGREHLALAPAIFTFNHTNQLDFFVNGLLCRPGWLVFGKRELAFIPFLGWAWALGGHPLIRRGDRAHWERVLATTAERLRDGWCTIVAPEGTRSRDGQLGQFKKGVVHMAIASRAPIVPLVIEGGATCLRGSTPVPGTIRVRALPPVDTTSWTLERADEHLDALRALYLEALGQAPAPGYNRVAGEPGDHS